MSDINNLVRSMAIGFSTGLIAGMLNVGLVTLLIMGTIASIVSALLAIWD